MRTLWILGTLIVMAVATGAAQSGRRAGPPPGRDDGPQRAALLRQRIADRFVARVKEQLGLDDAQVAKLRETTATYAVRRRELVWRERVVRRALAEQLRPGVGADQDSVARLNEALIAIKEDQAAMLRDEDRALAAFLTPVQRSQFFMLRERFHQRVQSIRDQRRGAAAAHDP